MWSLGITAIEMATGAPPYSNLPPYPAMLKITQQEPPNVPESKHSKEFRDFISQCLIKDVKQRPKVQELVKHPFLQINATTRELMTLIMRQSSNATGTTFTDDRFADEALDEDDNFDPNSLRMMNGLMGKKRKSHNEMSVQWEFSSQYTDNRSTPKPQDYDEQYYLENGFPAADPHKIHLMTPSHRQSSGSRLNRGQMTPNSGFVLQSPVTHQQGSGNRLGSVSPPNLYEDTSVEENDEFDGGTFCRSDIEDMDIERHRQKLSTFKLGSYDLEQIVDEKDEDQFDDSTMVRGDTTSTVIRAMSAHTTEKGYITVADHNKESDNEMSEDSVMRKRRKFGGNLGNIKSVEAPTNREDAFNVNGTYTQIRNSIGFKPPIVQKPRLGLAELSVVTYSIGIQTNGVQTFDKGTQTKQLRDGNNHSNNQRQKPSVVMSNGVRAGKEHHEEAQEDEDNGHTVSDLVGVYKDIDDLFNVLAKHTDKTGNKHLETLRERVKKLTHMKLCRISRFVSEKKEKEVSVSEWETDHNADFVPF